MQVTLSFCEEFGKFLSFDLGVFHYLQEQADADAFSSVNRYNGNPAVRVLHDDVATVLPDDFKTKC